MNNVLVVVSSNRGIDQHTLNCIRELVNAGAGYVEQRGTTGVSLARNIALSQACEVLEQHRARFDVVLMIDDDMFFTLEDAKRVTDVARQTQGAASLAYANADGGMIGKPISATRWMCGLGFMAIPADLLLELRACSEEFKVASGRKCYAFTWSGPEDGRWMPEDYRLGKRLGGVLMLPIAIGHMKKVPVYPGDNERVATIIDRALQAFGRPVEGSENAV